MVSRSKHSWRNVECGAKPLGVTQIRSVPFSPSQTANKTEMVGWLGNNGLDYLILVLSGQTTIPNRIVVWFALGVRAPSPGADLLTCCIYVWVKA